MSEFHDRFIGKCKFRDGFYITNDLYGGYSYDCEGGSGSVQYTKPEDVIDRAKKAGNDVHLAGNVWELVGKKGWGEKVSPDEATKLIDKLKEKQWKPGAWSGGPIKE